MVWDDVYNYEFFFSLKDDQLSLDDELVSFTFLKRNEKKILIYKIKTSVLIDFFLFVFHQ